MITLATYPMAQAAAMLDDQARSFATDEYLAPFMQFVQDQFEIEVLQNPELGALTTVVILDNVAANTPDLSTYFTAGQPLELLVEPISLKERSAASSRQEIDWQIMTRTRDLPTISPAAFSSYYSFTGDNIKISPADQATDIRVYGKFKARPIENGESPIVPNTSPILAAGTAALASMSRGNSTLYQAYESKRIAAQQSFVCDSILEQQHVRTRMRSYSGRGNIRQ